MARTHLPPGTTLSSRSSSAEPASPARCRAAVLLERQGGLTAMTELRARLFEVLRERPGTHAVDADGDAEITYQGLRGAARLSFAPIAHHETWRTGITLVIGRLRH
jgi:hypothetical protein